MFEAGLGARSPACYYQQTCGFSHTEEGADYERANQTGWKTSKNALGKAGKSCRAARKARDKQEAVACQNYKGFVAIS